LYPKSGLSIFTARAAYGIIEDCIPYGNRQPRWQAREIGSMNEMQKQLPWAAVTLVVMICIGAFVWSTFSTWRRETRARNYDSLVPDPVERMRMIINDHVGVIANVKEPWLVKNGTNPHLYRAYGRQPSVWFSFQLTPDTINTFKQSLREVNTKSRLSAWSSVVPKECAKDYPREVSSWWYKGETPVDVYFESSKDGGGFFIIIVPADCCVFGHWFGS
jgi:hypothetical protein